MIKQRADLEASMPKQKADYDAKLHLLQRQTVAAAAEAEAIAYEEAEVESGELSEEPYIEAEPFSTIQRTSEYVQQQSELFFSELPLKHAEVESHEIKTDKLEISNTKPATSHGIHRNTQPVYKDVKNE